MLSPWAETVGAEGDAGFPEDPESLRIDLLWLVRLRWFAAGGVFLFTLLGAHVVGIIRAPAVLCAVGLAIALYNVAFRISLARPVSTGRRLFRNAVAQIFLDLFALTFLLHLTGGVENPFTWLYLFHAIIAGILLPRRAAFAVAGSIVALFVVANLLTVYGFLPHSDLVVLPHPAIVNPSEMELGRETSLYMGVLLASFVVMVFGACWFTTVLVTRLRAREREARGRENLAVAGQLAAEVAHEILNPLGGIQRGVDLLKERIAGPERDRQLGILALVSEGLERIERISRGLLIQSRPTSITPIPCLLGDILRDALRFVGHKAEAKAVTLDIPGSGAEVLLHADPLHLSQAFINLLLNACDAVEIGGRVWVEIATSGGAAPEVRVRVCDDGHGISPEDLRRIFRPFFSTKRRHGKGTGLGLATTRRVVEEHGGWIDVASPPGGPTVFTVALPVRLDGVPDRVSGSEARR